MLRLGAPPLASRLGGWAPLESPAQRTAVTGQQWSLLIVVTAALVAMAAVVFDIRFSPDPSIALGPQASSVVESASPAAQERRTVAPPDTSSQESSLVAEAAVSEPASLPAQESTQTAQRSVLVRTEVTVPLSESAATNEAASIASGESAIETPQDSANVGITAAAVADDPASRIRHYLGLHAGAQLPVSFSYEVQAGDTASSIAARFGLEEATVLFNNFDIYDPNQLTAGQKLQLPSVDGLVYTVQGGDILDRLLDNFQGDLAATLAFPANGITNKDEIQVGQRLLLVHGSASLPTPAVASTSSGGGGAAAAQTWAEPSFIWPLGFDEISDLFGTSRPNAVGYHTGVDFVAPVGTLVGSSAAGQVTVATWDPSYGNWVEIDHGGGYRTRYAHLNEIFVREGEWLQANAYIGSVGNTGHSTGAHLHFEIIINGQAVNPLGWLN